jgi:hypothetical protein
MPALYQAAIYKLSRATHVSGSRTGNKVLMKISLPESTEAWANPQVVLAVAESKAGLTRNGNRTAVRTFPSRVSKAIQPNATADVEEVLPLRVTS